MHLHDRCICLYDLYRVLGYRYSQFTLLDPTLENCRVASGGVNWLYNQSITALEFLTLDIERNGSRAL